MKAGDKVRVVHGPLEGKRGEVFYVGVAEADIKFRGIANCVPILLTCLEVERVAMKATRHPSRRAVGEWWDRVKSDSKEGK